MVLSPEDDNAKVIAIFVHEVAVSQSSRSNPLVVCDIKWYMWQEAGAESCGHEEHRPIHLVSQRGGIISVQHLRQKMATTNRGLSYQQAYVNTWWDEGTAKWLQPREIMRSSYKSTML